MRKLILFLLFVFLIIGSDAQQKYRCEFFDTTITVIPESLFRDIASRNMWVTTELPAYVNPGIRTNNVKGAVLGFKYIEKTGTTTKSMLVKLEKVL